MKPLLYMRKKGLLGTAFGKHANSQRLSKSVGQFYDVNGAGGGGTTDFVFVMRTTADNETITLPATGTNNFEIDWGDGNVETITAPSPTHEYATAGDYTITISGQCSKWFFDNGGDKDKLIAVLNLGVVGWEQLDSGFFSCTNIERFTAGNSDTVSVTSMLNMLREWSFMIATPDLSGLDTSNVTSMRGMMQNWTSMTTPPDLSNFDTSSMQNMQSMMQNWTSMTTPPDLSNFDTSLVTTMAYMMRDWSSMTTPPDLSNFDTSLVTNMQSMMQNWPSMGEIDIPIDTWDIGLCSNMASMLQSSTLTTECYDRVLIAWAAQNVQSDVVAHFGNSKYSPAGETARDILTNEPNRWVISDGGPE